MVSPRGPFFVCRRGAGCSRRARARLRPARPRPRDPRDEDDLPRLCAPRPRLSGARPRPRRCCIASLLCCSVFWAACVPAGGTAGVAELLRGLPRRLVVLGRGSGCVMTGTVSRTAVRVAGARRRARLGKSRCRRTVWNNLALTSAAGKVSRKNSISSGVRRVFSLL